MTRFLVDVLGSGLGSLAAYDATSWPPGDSAGLVATHVDIALAADGDTLTCTPSWVRADGTSPSPPVVETVSKYVFVGTGPLSYADARATFPSNGTDLYARTGPDTPPLTSLSLQETLRPDPAANIGALPRTVTCTIRARDMGNSGLPVVATGTAAIVDDGTGTPRVINDWLFPLAVCGGVYVANATNPQNCGACGTVCPAGSTCTYGTCVCSSQVTSTATLQATVAHNVSVLLVGGGGGAAGVPSLVGGAGGGGGGGSSAVLVNGVATLVAAGGAGGAPSVAGSTNGTAVAGLAGTRLRDVVAVVGGDTLAVIVGGGGGGGGSLTAAPGCRVCDGPLGAGGGGGGAGFYGGGGGWSGDAASSPRAAGGGAQSGGAGSLPGTLAAGGDAQAGQCRCPAQRQARGGTASTQGAGSRPFFTSGLVLGGGAGGGGAYGGGGGAGSQGVTADNEFGFAGGGPGLAGGGGAAGATAWAGGAKAGVGAGGGAVSADGARLPGNNEPPVNQGGAAGLAVLTWEPVGGSCAF